MKKPKIKSFNKLVWLQQNHIPPKLNIIAKRFWFYKLDQQEGESVNKYVLELKKVLKICKFGDNLNNMIRDCGLKLEQIKKKVTV